MRQAKPFRPVPLRVESLKLGAEPLEEGDHNPRIRGAQCSLKLLLVSTESDQPPPSTHHLAESSRP